MDLVQLAGVAKNCGLPLWEILVSFLANIGLLSTIVTHFVHTLAEIH